MPAPFLTRPDGTLDVEQLQRFVDEMTSVDTGGRRLAVRLGAATVAFPGASPASNIVTVPHGMGRQPVLVLGVCDIAGVWSHPMTGTYTTTSFDVKVRTTDGTSPLAASATTVYWVAFG